MEGGEATSTLEERRLASTLEERRLASTLEERRLALDELRAKQDFDLRTRELDLKGSETGWVSRSFTPLSTTVLAGVITFAASVVGTLTQSHNALELERQKEQHELVLKMVSVGDQKQAEANLRFLAESQLIDPALAAHVLATKDAPVLPSSGPAGPTSARDFEAVNSDDRALDLVLAWEQGFTSDTSNPAHSVNSGVTLTMLSTYLGRQATPDELQALTPAAIRDFYRQYLSPAANLESQLLRTAFLNISVMSGPSRATQVFQAAGAKLGGATIAIDGLFGPSSVARINAAAAKDPDLVVETANCMMIRQLKTTPAWRTYGSRWLKRFRAFSPVALRGVCPELQETVADPAPGGTAAERVR